MYASSGGSVYSATDLVTIRWQGLKFLHDFSREISSPVEKDGREHIEYVPTQILTEFIRVVLGNGHPSSYGYEHFHNLWAGRESIDGIAYKSSRLASATCYCLFLQNDQCISETDELLYEVDEQYQRDVWGGIHDVRKRVVLDAGSTVRVEL
jgi:hypothetical protein